MDYKSTDFPQYRKLFNNKSYYKIISDREFEEIQQIGEKYYLYKVKAEQYFEILKIQDMLDFNNKVYSELSEHDYTSILLKIA